METEGHSVFKVCVPRTVMMGIRCRQHGDALLRLTSGRGQALPGVPQAAGAAGEALLSTQRHVRALPLKHDHQEKESTVWCRVRAAVTPPARGPPHRGPPT